MRTKRTTLPTNQQPSAIEDEDLNDWNCALSKGMRRRLRAQGLDSPNSVDFSKCLPSNIPTTALKHRSLMVLPEDSLVALKSKLSAARNNFLRSSFFIAVQDAIKTGLASLNGNLKDNIKILCLGLGNPSVDRSSLRQLAFLSALVESVPQLSYKHTFLYDPVFRKTSRTFIRRQGFQVRICHYFHTISVFWIFFFVISHRDNSINPSITDHCQFLSLINFVNTCKCPLVSSLNACLRWEWYPDVWLLKSPANISCLTFMLIRSNYAQHAFPNNNLNAIVLLPACIIWIR